MMAPSPAIIDDEACGPAWAETRRGPWPSAGPGPGVLPSYRARTPSKTRDLRPSPQGIGIDKLAISVPIEDFNDDDDIWNRCQRKSRRSEHWSNTRSTAIPLIPRVHLYVEVYAIPSTQSYWATFEFNPSRIVDPAGYGLCEVTDLPYSTGMAWDKACKVLTPACRIDEARIKRLDAARDGTCSDPTMYLDAIFRVPAAYARERTLWADASTGQSGTLYVGGKTTGRVSFYSKYVKNPDKAKQEEWRFEVQAREGWLNKPGRMYTLADVSTESVETLLKDRWDWMGMSTAVKTRDQWVHDIYDADILTGSEKLMSEGQKERLIGYFTLVAAGRKPAEPANSRMADYRRAIRQVGIFLSTDRCHSRPAVIRSLDFATGSEALRAA